MGQNFLRDRKKEKANELDPALGRPKVAAVAAAFQHTSKYGHRRT